MENKFNIGDTVRWGHGKFKSQKLFVSAVFDGSYKCDISYEPSEKLFRDKLVNPENGYAVYPVKWFISAKAILTEKL